MPTKHLQKKCDARNRPDDFRKLRASLKAASDHKALAREVHTILDRVNEIEKTMWVYADILAAHDVAVCDFCGWEWFTVKPIQGYGPRGDVRGLLIAGVACCTKCLDALYVSIEDMVTDEEELQKVYEDIAFWSARVGTRYVLKHTGWDTVSEIKHIWKTRLP